MNELEQALFELLRSEAYSTRIRKAGVYLFPADYRFAPHAHPEYEINYINTGHCIMSVGEDYAPLRQGNVSWCPLKSPTASWWMGRSPAASPSWSW